jgi:hypothetical protein
MPQGESLASRLELGLVLIAVALLVVVGCREVVRAPRSARTMAVGAAACAAIALVRGALTRWSLIHAEFCGTDILNNVFTWPTRPMDYGVFHSLVYGGAMRLVGPDLATVAALNELLAAATLVLMAILGWAWTGSRLAGAAVVSVGLLHPVVMRMAGSEEGHNLAVLMGFGALAAIEAYRSTPRRPLLVLLACATTLMIDTKPMMLMSVPCVALLGYLRAPPGHRRAVLIALSGALPVLALRLFDGLQRPYGEYTLGQRLQPTALAIAAETHPFFDPRGPIYVFLPLLAAGLVWLYRWGRDGRAVIVCLAWLFLSSFLLMEGQSVSLIFRLPVLTLAIVVEGIGAWLLVRTAAARVTGAAAVRGVTASLLLLLALAPVVEPGFSVVREVSSPTREYDYLRGLATRLPPGVTFVTTRMGPRSPAFPAHLFSRVGARVTKLKWLTREDFDRGPVLFFHGLECAAYYFAESQPPNFDVARARRSWQPGIGTFPRFEDIEAPADPRPVCEQLIAGATPWDVPTAVSTPRQLESPMIVYGHDTTTLQVFQLRPSVLDGAVAAGPAARSR